MTWHLFYLHFLAHFEANRRGSTRIWRSLPHARPQNQLQLQMRRDRMQKKHLRHALWQDKWGYEFPCLLVPLPHSQTSVSFQFAATAQVDGNKRRDAVSFQLRGLLNSLFGAPDGPAASQPNIDGESESQLAVKKWLRLYL